MKKSNLTNGMVVECRNEFRYLVLPNIFINIDGYNNSVDYNEDLCCDTYEFDIVKVYKINFSNCRSISDIFDTSNLVLIWQRPGEVLELTLEDIAKKYNVDVTRIKIKK